MNAPNIFMRHSSGLRRRSLVSEIVEKGLTLKFMHALGWQGGTVHGVADELIKRDLADLPLYEALRTLELERDRT